MKNNLVTHFISLNIQDQSDILEKLLSRVSYRLHAANLESTDRAYLRLCQDKIKTILLLLNQKKHMDNIELTTEGSKILQIARQNCPDDGSGLSQLRLAMAHELDNGVSTEMRDSMTQWKQNTDVKVSTQILPRLQKLYQWSVGQQNVIIAQSSQEFRASLFAKIKILRISKKVTKSGRIRDEIIAKNGILKKELQTLTDLANVHASAISAKFAIVSSDETIEARCEQRRILVNLESKVCARIHELLKEHSAKIQELQDSLCHKQIQAQAIRELLQGAENDRKLALESLTKDRFDTLAAAITHQFYQSFEDAIRDIKSLSEHTKKLIAEKTKHIQSLRQLQEVIDESKRSRNISVGNDNQQGTGPINYLNRKRTDFKKPVDS